MAEKPIIFNTDMVQAILEGRKTQTRRLIKPQPYYDPNLQEVQKINNLIYWKAGAITLDELATKCPYGQIGDILWVRETWQYKKYGDYGYTPKDFMYLADPDETWVGPWCPSIHMPREAARIFLRVTDIRVEQLQDISEEDAIAEGVKRYTIVDAWFHPTGYYAYGKKCHDTAREGFRDTWDELYSKGYSWDINPWVWVIKFEVL